MPAEDLIRPAGSVPADSRIDPGGGPDRSRPDRGQRPDRPFHQALSAAHGRFAAIVPQRNWR